MNSTMKRFFYAVGMASLLTACSEEVETAAPDIGKTSREITLTADITDGGWQGPTRAAVKESCDTVQKGKLLSQAGDSLVLLCTETDSFLCRKDTVPFSSRYSLPLTRGTLKRFSDIEADGFGVSCAIYPADGSYTEYGGGSYFFDHAVTAGTPTGYLWPSEDYHLAFYAYYPYGSEHLSLLSTASDKGAPTYGYTVPSDISTQLDIMTAQVTDHPGGPQRACQLPFTHHCAAIRVVFTNEKDTPLKVNSVSVSGVKYSGTLHEGTWTLDEPVNSSVANPFILSFGEGDGIVPGSGVTNLTGTERILLMLPQTLTANALLTVETDKGRFEGVLTGTWTAGNTYTYNVILADSYDFILNVTEPGTFTYEGGTDGFSVQSYKVKEDGLETKAVSWTATYSTDGGETFSAEKPSWLTTSADAGDGGTVPTGITATVAPQVMSQEVYTAERYLKETEEVTDYDLSTKGGTQLMNTANCYLVNGPGTYRLPLVYGNAIKDGEINEEAYTAPVDSSSSARYTAVNHNDDEITNPWLKNNNATPDGAGIVWQDADGLISDVAIQGDYLTFAIDRSTITGGNAVIAAKMGETIVWSWHIWVTPETYATTYQTENYKTAPSNLGWIDIETMTITDHPSRSCIIKIKQTGARGVEQTFEVQQKKSHAVNINYSKWGFCTYYQHLRKDPEYPYKNVGDAHADNILTWGEKNKNRRL